MPTTTIALPTSDGPCTTEFHTPDGSGPWPAVILFFDAAGQRPSISAIAERIAKSGYIVAVPDLFHRSGSVTALIPDFKPGDYGSLFKIFGDEALRTRFFTEFYTPALDYTNLKTDVGAVIAALDKRSDFSGKIGTTGYCMGGNASLRAATIFGDRIAATASFHGGGLATGDDSSPHKRAASIKSRVYVAGAEKDDSFPDAAKATLIEALDAAHVKNTVETYPALHGFAVKDNPSHDAAAEERHFKALDTLYSETLK